MYAIVEAGGKQHKVEQGKYFFTEKVNAEAVAVLEKSAGFEAKKSV